MDSFIKIVSLISGIVAAYKAFDEVVINNKPRLREEFKFSKEFIEETLNKDKPHPLLIERGYLAMTGEFLSCDEIIHLLNFPNPSLMFRHYKLAEQYIEYNRNRKQVRYKPKYDNENTRKQIKARYIVYYAIYASLAAAPLLFLPNFFDKINLNLSILLALGILTFSFGYLAYLSLVAYGRVTSAEKVIEQETKRCNS